MSAADPEPDYGDRPRDWIAGPVGLPAATRANLHRVVIADLERRYPGTVWTVVSERSDDE